MKRITTRRLGEHELEQLLDAGLGLVSKLDLEAILNRLVQVARDVTGARYAALGILDEDKRTLERFVYVGIDEEVRRAIGPLPEGRGILGELIRDPKPLRLTDVSEHPRSYGFPPGHPSMTSFLGVPVVIRDEAYGNLYLTEKRGGEFDQVDERSVEILAEWAAIAIGNARLYERVEARRAELERAVRGLEATATIASAVDSETDLERVLELIVKRGRALIEARTMLVLLEDQGVLRVTAAAGEGGSAAAGETVAIEGSAPGEVFRSRRPERLLDAANSQLGELGVSATSALLVPLVTHGRARGVLLGLDRMQLGPAFDADDEYLLNSFAASAATAIATAQSVEADRLRHTIEASEQERKRWARELHDATLQDLGALRVLLESARQKGTTEQLQQAVDQAMDQIELSITELHGLIAELRPSALDELGVEPALHALVERTAGTTGIAIDTDLRLRHGRGEDRLPALVESTVYRVVQEALNNVVKHARARHARVSVVEDDRELDVTVRDDGSGFNAATADGGFGLTGMRERVSLVGGRLAIDSAPGAGTTVHARIPIAQPVPSGPKVVAS